MEASRLGRQHAARGPWAPAGHPPPHFHVQENEFYFVKAFVILGFLSPQPQPNLTESYLIYLILERS